MDSTSPKIIRGRTVEEPVVLAEISAMIRYASERGLDPAGKLLVPLYQAVQKDHIDGTVIGTYAQLVSLVNNGHTGPTVQFDGVNGRTLLDTEYRYESKARPVVLLGILFLLLAMLAGALDLWLKGEPKPSGDWMVWLANTHRYFLSKLSPFLWGATGACVFIMKRLSDKAADRCFDSLKWQGWGTRIILGAILGAIAVVIYDVKAFTEVGAHLSANAVAFLAGVGVRVIYGALEKTIDVLVEKLKLGGSQEATAQAAVHAAVPEKPPEPAPREKEEEPAQALRSVAVT